ncbi:MAG: TIGR01777 family protein [Candidatus Omnitrophica bacterium CG11_big_fil_rev_8_21_14_0_20_64_10]|nr:MAG: TIGR01777 family protein [Candidatus Omnitrophica bacterium CG11_big_fil_rev_8_21_14_0_20_64_10]
MRILISGSSGMIGRALQAALKSAGHAVTRLVRSGGGPDTLLWNPDGPALEPEPFEGFDAVIHLAGDPIAEGRWTPAKKERIRTSRVRGTRLLCGTLARLKRPPRTLLCASAIGIYGNRGEEPIRETAGRGNGFLAEVGEQWEEATAPAQRKGIRTALLRTGIVLSAEGGALAKMLPPFRLGLGGPIGSGRQFMSWITLTDEVGAILHILNHPELRGPVNLTAPHPVTNAEFTKALGRVLHRPAIFPVPAPMLKLMFGEMAEAILLGGARVEPGRLLESGYRFQQPELEPALRELLKANNEISRPSGLR